MTFSRTLIFPSTIIEWKKLDWKIEKSGSIETFEKIMLSFISVTPNSTFSWNNP